MGGKIKTRGLGVWLVVKDGKSCLGIKKRKLAAVKKDSRWPTNENGEGKGGRGKREDGPWKVRPLHDGRRMRGGHEVFVVSFSHWEEVRGMI